MPPKKKKSKEAQRLSEKYTGSFNPWYKWGPYVSERAWGTVREDYSEDGNAWDYFPHELARSKSYRWGEDGLAGICDRYQVMAFSLGLWNGNDDILKERLYGLIPAESNHGEDVKEYYFYLDNTPTHSYMKFLYKYPHAKYPYDKLIEESGKRSVLDREYELIDTGVFDENRYFDVYVEYAKTDQEDFNIKITAYNRGPEAATIHLIPQLWFRNTWGWSAQRGKEPNIEQLYANDKGIALLADDSRMDAPNGLSTDYRLGKRWLYAEPGGTPLFTNNETNAEKVWGDHAESASPYVKDGFHRAIIDGESSVNPELNGTKACIHYGDITIPAGGSHELNLRFSDKELTKPLADAKKLFTTRVKEADAFYESVHPANASADEKLVQRQSLAGMLWTKQIYLYHVSKWMEGDNPNFPPSEARKDIRNRGWGHLNSMRIFSMPDKWEYPWFAAWDLAFHCAPLALVDAEFAKEQLWLLLFEQFQHPNGQIPAYEWEFSDLNPPVQAWSVWRVYNMDRLRSGKADRDFLERCFHKLLINFAWWVNRVDGDDLNVFEGGFLGLDNITVLDRSVELPEGVSLKQSDGTGWMGMYCLNMMRIALELARENNVYESLATKFFQHYVYIGAAMKKMGGKGYELWSETDGFFYDALCYPDGSYHKFRVRSLVGLIPLFAIERLEECWIEPFKEFKQNLDWFLKNRQDIVQRCVTTIEKDGETVHVLAIMNPDQMKRILERVWDPEEFRSDYGLRSLSRHHKKHPFIFGEACVEYDPAESSEYLKGGNSNWRGPIWFPASFMMIESLRKLKKAFGEDFKVTTSDNKEISLDKIASGFADRLIHVFTRDEQGRRAVFGDNELFQDDPHWRDNILFYEYFHGDTGEGLGASHQTGWTGLVANLIDEWRR
jgi:hypothetical protein